MNQNTHSFSTSKTSSPIQINLDEFNLSEDSFRPMTKGLGFHQEQKRSSFKPTPKEVKPFGVQHKMPRAGVILNPLSNKNTEVASQHVPSGLEAFYGAKVHSGNQNQLNKIENKIEFASNDLEVSNKVPYPVASGGVQLLAWGIDLLVVASFVVVTGALLVLASGIQWKMFARLISYQDFMLFTAVVFSIYYLFYFTILELSASPGKTIMGIRLLRIDNANVSVKHTFTRALVSLLSGIVFFLPMLLDFQGRLSGTKVVK